MKRIFKLLVALSLVFAFASPNVSAKRVNLRARQLNLANGGDVLGVRVLGSQANPAQVSLRLPNSQVINLERLRRQGEFVLFQLPSNVGTLRVEVLVSGGRISADNPRVAILDLLAGQAADANAGSIDAQENNGFNPAIAAAQEGPQGPQGEQGEQGPQGVQGPVGPAGQPGINGVDGDPGRKNFNGAPIAPDENGIVQVPAGANVLVLVNRDGEQFNIVRGFNFLDGGPLLGREISFVVNGNLAVDLNENRESSIKMFPDDLVENFLLGFDLDLGLVNRRVNLRQINNAVNARSNIKNMEITRVSSTFPLFNSAYFSCTMAPNAEAEIDEITGQFPTRCFPDGSVFNNLLLFVNEIFGDLVEDDFVPNGQI